MIYQVTIPGHSVSKKNSKRIVGFKGSPRLISSKAYYEWERMAIARVNASQKPENPIEQARLVHILFSMADKRPRDLSNMCEGVMDTLVKCGVLLDDKWTICPRLELEARHTGTAFVQVTIDYGDFSEI